MRARTSNSSTPQLASSASCKRVAIHALTLEACVTLWHRKSKTFDGSGPASIAEREVLLASHPHVSTFHISSVPSRVRAAARLYERGEHELLRATRTWMDCTSAIHRDWSVAVCRDAAASVPAGMRAWQIGRTITLISSPQFETVVSSRKFFQTFDFLTVSCCKAQRCHLIPSKNGRPDPISHRSS